MHIKHTSKKNLFKFTNHVRAVCLLSLMPFSVVSHIQKYLLLKKIFETTAKIETLTRLSMQHQQPAAATRVIACISPSFLPN